MEREKKETEFEKLAQNLANVDDDGSSEEVLEKKSEEFQKILETPKEQRDRIQRMQVIDRAAAAIAAARSIIKKKDSSQRKEDSKNENVTDIKVEDDGKNYKIYIFNLFKCYLLFADF